MALVCHVDFLKLKTTAYGQEKKIELPGIKSFFFL